MTLEHINETAKHAVDALSIGTLIAALVDWAPKITVILVALWTVMRMYESWQNIRINNKKMGGE